jgi:hypothetical protein
VTTSSQSASDRQSVTFFATQGAEPSDRNCDAQRGHLASCLKDYALTHYRRTQMTVVLLAN